MENKPKVLPIVKHIYDESYISGSTNDPKPLFAWFHIITAELNGFIDELHHEYGGS